jgi:sporulation protein YlmC with PRC-barrel domain
MNRFITCTALGLVLGLAPALAQDQPPAEDTQAPPAASEQPALPEVMPSEPSQPSDPAAPIPGDTSEAPNPASPPSAEAPAAPDQASPPSAEAPQPIEPAAPKSAEAPSDTQFLSKQESSDFLASSLIGQSVYNSQDEAIGSISDLVTDESGKVVAVLIGSGGFLGMGEKDVAVRFEDLRLAREDDSNLKVIANIDKDTLASAPDYEKLSEQDVTVGSSKEDREDAGESGPTQSY